VSAQLEITVKVVGDHLFVTLPGHGPELLRVTVRDLMLCLADVGVGRSHFLGDAHQRTRNRLFPPAYRSSIRSSRFEFRHGAEIRSDLWAAAERVLARLGGDNRIPLPVADAEDWIRVLGAARFLFVDRKDRPGPDPEAAAKSDFLAAVQWEIVTTLRPELPTGEVLEEA
jgi:hypothetical protein